MSNRPTSAWKTVGLIVAGLIAVIGVLGVLVLIMSMSMCHTFVTCDYEVAERNVRQLCLVSRAYAIENQGLLPVATWPDVFREQKYIADERVLLDPGNRETGRMFAMNAALRDAVISSTPDNSRTVLLFECSPGAPPAGGRELLPAAPRYKGKYLIGFVNCHVDWIGPDELDGLIWDPTAGPAAKAREAATPAIP